MVKEIQVHNTSHQDNTVQEKIQNVGSLRQGLSLNTNHHRTPDQHAADNSQITRCLKTQQMIRYNLFTISDLQTLDHTHVQDIQSSGHPNKHTSVQANSLVQMLMVSLLTPYNVINIMNVEMVRQKNISVMMGSRLMKLARRNF